MRYRSWRPADVAGNLPTLYLLHGVGAGDDQHIWHHEQGGRLQLTLQALVNSKSIRPLNVVTPFGRPPGLRPGPGRFPHAGDFHDYMLKLVATVEADPRVSAVPQNPAMRAIAGLSMGGWQAIGIFLRSPRFFTALGNFSGAVQMPFDEEGRLSPTQLPPIPLLYTTCGLQDARCLEPNRKFVKQLVDAGIPETHDFPPGKHNWAFWQGALDRFARRLHETVWGRQV